MSSRKSIKEESAIHHSELRDNLEGLKLLKNIITTCRGPHGKVKVIQNSSGGHVTLTSSSGRLLPVLSISKPLLKLLVSSAEAHLHMFSDGGLSLMAWCLNIVESSKNSLVSNRCLIELYDELMEMASCVLSSDDFPGRINLTLSNIAQMLSLVRTILSSKPLCNLSSERLKHLAAMIVECFLSSAKESDKNTNCVLILTVEGVSASQSNYVPGILMMYPDISSSCVKKLQFSMKDKRITVALVTVSMSGDSEEVIQGQYERNIEVNAEKTVIDYMKTFCDHLIGCGVEVIMCQKVIHPWIKSQLRQRNVFVIERMGARLASFVQDLAGATPINSFSCDPENCLGHLDSIDHVILNKKSYLHLQRAASGINTLMLYGMEEEMVSELKLVCETALSTLQNILQCPIMLCGGGCWETSLGFHIKRKVNEKKNSILEKIGCTSSALSSACEIFCKSLFQVAMTTGHAGVMMMTSFPTFHCWRVPLDSDEQFNAETLTCACGTVSEQFENLISLNDVNVDAYSSIDDVILKNEVYKIQQISQTKLCVLDSYITYSSAFRKAVFTANMVLNVGNCLQDIN